MKPIALFCIACAVLLVSSCMGKGVRWAERRTPTCPISASGES